MSRLAWLTLALVVVATRGFVADDTSPTLVTVGVVNRAGVAQDMLTHAEAESARIYANIGVTVRWFESDGETSCLSTDLTITIARVTPSMRDAPSADTLGRAPGTRDQRGRLAYVYFDRIDRSVRPLTRNPTQLLAFVMAHEMGHLLLPYGAHTDRGIMRRAWSWRELLPAYVGEQQFSVDEGELIRRRVRALHAPDDVIVPVDSTTPVEP